VLTIVLFKALHEAILLAFCREAAWLMQARMVQEWVIWELGVTQGDRRPRHIWSLSTYSLNYMKPSQDSWDSD